MKTTNDIAHWRTEVFSSLLSTVAKLGTGVALASIGLAINERLWPVAIMDTLAMVWLLVTWAVVYVLVEVADLPTWASFLIVAGFYLLVAIILGTVGYFRLKKARGPEMAQAEMQRTKQIVESLPPNTPPVPSQLRNPTPAKESSKA